MARAQVTGLTLMAIGLTMGVTSATASAQTPSFPTPSAELPVGEGVVQPCLDEVPGEVVCGRFRVWEDREAEEGRTVDLAFVVLRALENAGHSDAVTQFNGGPGAGTTAGAAGAARFWRPIRETRDVLLIDHRGTGNSQALACTNPFPGGIPSRFGTIFPLDHVEACRNRLSQRADLDQYTTPRAMDDLAELTRWLGYTGLNLRGGSYGTREAAIFARRHPELTRTVILNGVALTHEPGYVQHARYLHESLANLVEECGLRPRCREAYPDLPRVIDTVLDRIQDRPGVRIQGNSVRFGPGDLSYALRGLLYGRSGELPAMLSRAATGEWQELAEFYLQRQAWVGGTGVPAGYHFSVLCAEDIDRVTWSDIEDQTEGTFMGDHLIASYKRACELWPAARLPESYFEPVSSEAPTLILSGGRDPVTPPENGHALAELWPNSLHVVVPNGGHGQGGPCVGAMMGELIVSGSVEEIDTSCVASAPPTEFVLPGG